MKKIKISPDFSKKKCFDNAILGGNVQKSAITSVHLGDAQRVLKNNFGDLPSHIRASPAYLN